MIRIGKTLNIAAATTAFAAYLSLQTSLEAASYEVRGFLNHVGFSQRAFTNSSPFRIVVSGDQWQIYVGEPGISNSITVCDDTNIFYFNQGKIIHFSGKPPLPPDSYEAEVEKAPIPSGDCAAQVLWLAYASSKVVATNPVDLPAPWLNVRYNVKSHAYASKVEVSENLPYLPSSASFTLTKDRADRAASSPWLVSERPPGSRDDYHSWKPFEPYGFVGARYNVLAVTNVHSMVFPVAFELLVFRPSSEMPVEAYRGSRIVIETAVKSMEVKSPDKPVFVTDYRFNNRNKKVDFIRYTTRQWIIPAQSRELSQIFEQKLNDPHAGPRSLLSPEDKPSLKWLRIVIFTAFIGPFFWIAYRLVSKRTANS